MKPQLTPLGGMTWLYRVWPERPHHQAAPKGKPPVTLVAERLTVLQLRLSVRGLFEALGVTLDV